MSFYANADQLYTCLGALFDRVLEQSPAAAQAIAASRLIIRLRLTAPAAEVTLHGKQRPVQALRGPTVLRPDLEVSMDADTLHLILLDQLSLKEALADGDLKIRGPLWKFAALAELLRQARRLYPDVLREQGLHYP